MTHTRTLLFTLLLGATAGCGTAFASAPRALARQLPVAKMVPPFNLSEPTARSSLTLAAAPVQVDTATGLVENLFGDALPTDLLPWTDDILRDWSTATSDPTPTIVESRNRYSAYNVYFDRSTFPVGPYGTFWIGIDNSTDHAVTVSPKQLSLVVDGKKHAAVADSGAIQGHYELELDAMKHRWNLLTTARNDLGVYEWMPYMLGAVTIPPHQRWSGYVSFDVFAYTADEYNAFLGKAKTISLELREDHGPVVALTFATRTAALPVVCLPDTKTAQFERCERAQ